MGIWTNADICRHLKFVESRIRRWVYFAAKILKCVHAWGFEAVHGKCIDGEDYAWTSNCFASKLSYLLIPFPSNYLKPVHMDTDTDIYTCTWQPRYSKCLKRPLQPFSRLKCAHNNRYKVQSAAMGMPEWVPRVTVKPTHPHCPGTWQSLCGAMHSIFHWLLFRLFLEILSLLVFKIEVFKTETTNVSKKYSTS